jgi:predicted GNAT family N-acyltransferase
MPLEIEVLGWADASSLAMPVRIAVFVVEQGVPADIEIDEWDPPSLHAIARREGQVVGTARLLPDGHVGRMAVLAAERRRGVGRALLQRLVALACSRGDHAIVLNAQVQALPFYLANGFVVDSPEFLEVGIPHRRMRWSVPCE